MDQSHQFKFEVQQTPNGNWHIVAYGAGVVRGVTSFGSQAEAKAWIAGARSSEWAQSWEAEAMASESVSPTRVTESGVGVRTGRRK